MPTITYELADGTRTDIKVDVGANVMRTAIDADIPGIVAECGGAAMCATCHVYLEKDSASAFTTISDVEEEMLECVAEDRQPESRLSCQLYVPEGIEKIIVRIPETQG